MTEATGLSPFRNLLSSLMRAPLRFPVPLACAAAWAGVTITMVVHNLKFGGLSRDAIEQQQVFFLGALFLSLAAALFAEGRGWNKPRSVALSVAAMTFAGLVVYLENSSNAWESPGFYLLVPGGGLLMIVAPFLRRGADDRAVWDFNLTSWLSVLFGGILAAGLGLGLTAVLSGLEILFGLSIKSDYYADAWIVCMSLVWPWQTLAGIPGACDEPAGKAPPRWTEYVVSWLLIPLALIYLLLLYGFAAKVLATWSLPRGTVGWLVGGFAAFGLAVWSAAYPFRETGNRLVRLYHRFFHYALIVPVILLAVGVGARIAEYGVTERRYALILITLWLGGIAVYGILARPARLAVAPAIFGAMLIAGAIGPWSATPVSIRSQLGQLESMLAEAGILVDGEIIPDEGRTGPKAVKRISSIVRYLMNDGRRGDLETWMKDAGAEPDGGEDDDELLTLLGGLEYIEEWEDEGAFSYSVGEYETFDVAGFEIIHNLGLSPGMSKTLTAENSGNRYEVRFDGQVLHVTLAGRPGAAIFDLDAMVETLRPMQIRWGDPAGRETMTLNAWQNGLRARLHVETISGQQTPDGNRINYGITMLLVGPAE